MSFISAITVGSIGDAGRTFTEDLQQADGSSILFAMLGVFISTFFINPFLMRKPVDGPPVKAKE